ncbi:hypothetical protein NC653_002481 [Populus alba x Populus x berolinensis]|uniref:Uncharacterized protein n=1 Tax=Populus alba x Populus x berolinensis TaxID=444605 RepID=A0AAD6WJ92_9ROSI|nr:hypothetical protein NC653_002481 [Populus alba x Populus x berolinensis]
MLRRKYHWERLVRGSGVASLSLAVDGLRET